MRKADAALTPEIEKILPGCTVEKDKKNTLGGLRIVIDKILYDETMDTAAKEERKAFLTRCKLHVNPMEVAPDEPLAGDEPGGAAQGAAATEGKA